MKKDFIEVTPDQGSFDSELTVIADMNLNANARSTTLNFSAQGGASRAVPINQSGYILYEVYFTNSDKLQEVESFSSDGVANYVTGLETSILVKFRTSIQNKGNAAQADFTYEKIGNIDVSGPYPNESTQNNSWELWFPLGEIPQFSTLTFKYKGYPVMNLKR